MLLHCVPCDVVQDGNVEPGPCWYCGSADGQVGVLTIGLMALPICFDRPLQGMGTCWIHACGSPPLKRVDEGGSGLCGECICDLREGITRPRQEPLPDVPLWVTPWWAVAG